MGLCGRRVGDALCDLLELHEGICVPMPPRDLWAWGYTKPVDRGSSWHAIEKRPAA